MENNTGLGTIFRQEIKIGGESVVEFVINQFENYRGKTKLVGMGNPNQVN